MINESWQELTTEELHEKYLLAKAAADAALAVSQQVGGSHYSNMPIQPFTYIYANGLGFAEGCVVKYVSRWKAKNGIEDLRKAKHFLELLIEAELKNNGDAR